MRKLYFLTLAALVLYSCKPVSTSKEFNPDAELVWVDESGEGRQVYLAFRKDFDLGSEPKGEIHLYAHSRYHLFVNGEFINFGPVRAYAESPEYDSYEISPFLKEGKNFIVLKVLNDGMITYQVPEGPGAMISWGQIISSAKNVDLSTPGDWKVLRLNGYDPTSPKMTFATGAIENYDARKDPGDIMEYDCDLSNWTDAVPLSDQDIYNDFIPRTIPPLTQEELLPKAYLGLYSLNDDEDIYSFRVKAPDETREAFGKNRIAYAQTWIYSPVNQSVDMGLWWGEYFVNGKGPLTEFTESKDKLYRREYPVKLKKGWNHFFVQYGIVWASWDFYMAVPKSSGLHLSPDKILNDDVSFITIGPFPDDEEQRARDVTIPFENRDVLSGFSVEWKERKGSETAGNPAFEVAWRSFDEAIAHTRKFNKAGHEIVDHGNHVPESFELKEGNDYGLVYDMGGKTLGRIFIDAVAPEGTVFNIVFTEDTIENRPWILKRVGLYTGARFVASSGSDYFETFKPYGAKFLQLNIENANGPVKINKVGMISQVYPYKKTGSFECSDPLLNEIWEMGWRTVEVCSEDTYTDTPFRERGLYAGDALPQYAISLAGSGDSRLMKRSIRVFADMYQDLMVPDADRRTSSVNHMADYPLATLISWLWSVSMTRDLDFAREYYEGYRNMLDAYISRQMDNGLYDHDRAFIEWTQIDKSANLTTIQSMLIYSLESFAWLADEMGYNDDAIRYRNEAAGAKEKMLELCWDPDKKAFRDGFREGNPIDHHYPISSAWPVIFGQTTEQMEAELEGHFIKTLTEIGKADRQRNTTPYGSFYIIEALYKMGMEEFAEFFIRKYWSAMIYKHNDTAWENFGDGSDGGGQGTLSHAWSGHPTYFMSTRILGVQLGFPEIGFHDKIVIRPQAANISWAKGSVPHPLGLVQVEWKVMGDKLLFSYAAPEDAQVIVEPVGKLADRELIIQDYID
jgi:hypothetical protein